MNIYADPTGAQPTTGEAVEAELYRVLVENTADIIVHGDARTLKRTYVSPSCLEVLGFSPEEMLGREGYELVHRDDLAAVAAEIAQLGPSRPLARCTFRMRRKDGGFTWIEGRYRYIERHGGVLAVLRDISEHKAAEVRIDQVNAQLQAANTLLAATFDHMVQGVSFFDGEQKLILCNRRYADIYHLPPDIMQSGITLTEIVARRYEAGSAPDMPEGAYMEWRNDLHAKGKHFDSQVTLRNGRTILIVHHAMEDGGWIATHEDVTERRRTEEMLHHAQKLESVGRLTAGIAHDFNNFMQTVSLALESVVTEGAIAADPMLLQLVTDAQLAVRNAGQLTQHLLSFAGKQVLKPELVDIETLIRSMGGLLAQACGKSITLRVVPVGGPFPSRADVGQFRSALLNLAINARDAMPAGGSLAIGIETVTRIATQDALATATQGSYICVQVHDVGQGISPEDLPLVFDPFFTTKPFGEGSGLGLAQVHGFAQQSGGSVSISSTLGEGTIVTLLLPWADPAVAPCAP